MKVTLSLSLVEVANRQPRRRVARNESEADDQETFARTAGMTGIVLLHERKASQERHYNEQKIQCSA